MKQGIMCLMRIYTKTGDAGETGLSDGKRYRKSDDVFWLIGDIDELCAWIGACEAKFIIYNSEFRIEKNQKSKSKNQNDKLKIKDLGVHKNPLEIRRNTDASLTEREITRLRDGLQRVQGDLFLINSVLAGAKNIKFDSKRETEWLEREIDEMTLELPELRNFILPGGSEIASFLHLARAVCRRVERRFVMFQNENMAARENSQEILPFFNRLSDYFFTLARLTNFKMGEKEEIWKM